MKNVVRVMGACAGSLFGILSLSAARVCPARTPAHPPDAQRPDIFIDPQSGDDYGGYNFIGKRLHENLCILIARRDAEHSDLVIQSGYKVTTMPDERISEPQNDASTPYGANFVLMPGETFKGYDFYLSPDENWLMVQRGGIHGFSVCYLYHRTDATHMTPVYVGGLRLDDAALAVCAKSIGANAAVLGGGARTTHAIHCDWKAGKIRFRIEASSYWFTPGPAGTPKVAGNWNVTYDLKTQKLSVAPTKLFNQH